ncbi:hypothetical protein AAC387_Pa07g2992 [Persea americana]
MAFSSSFFIIFISSIIPLALSQLPPQNQIDIIKTISKNISSPSWNTTGQNPCFWKGVTCTGNSITGISLSKLGISSTGILTDLCKIDSLQSVDVSNNQISGTPDEFLNDCGKLNVLKVLNISMNRLIGPLPTFSGFPALESLVLSSNSFVGVIDFQLDGLVSLKNLDLSKNFFSGNVPTRLGKNPGLRQLQLSSNMFSGLIPVELLNYTNLILLDLSFNNLSGSIPTTLESFTNLQTLILSANHLDGEVPQFLSRMPTLSRFSANQNSFTGAIPPGLTQYLKILDLSYNRLAGPIPVDLLSPQKLQYVDLMNNNLEGEIPTNISLNLLRLRLSGNSLTGSIPSSIGKVLDLTYLELDGNRLTGSIPLELENCVKLTLLNLASNLLQGPLPKGLGKLLQLVVLKLSGNQFTREIPPEISQLTNLSTIDLSWNSLTGNIPSGITSLGRLSILNLGGNILNGSIPASITGSVSLLELQLGRNMLGGAIPQMPSSLQIALNLSNNHFSGPIPSTLRSLTRLEVLDLSNNQFTGEVPTFLAQLGSLTRLLLANNSLSGTLPRFDSWTTVVYDGNNDLKAPTPIPSPIPPIVSRRKRSPAILVTIVAVVGAVLAVVIVAVVLIVSRRFYRVDDENQGSEENLPQVIDGHLITTDSIHKSSIDFTRAMEAVSYPLNVIMKSRFSTYYKALMPSGMSYCVKKLNWSDKIFQLGSHEKFGQELQILGRLNNSRVMIPLAYVLTADNAYLFYEHAHMGTLFDFLHKSSDYALDWTCRYSIALGVAQGLSFLHGCKDPILLLDLSTKTILLKSLTEPQIADIELCKVIDPSKSTGSLSTVAGSVGYIHPEYAYTMRVTTAGNVYSFGVVLLELLTGKPAVSAGTELAKWVSSKSAQDDAWEQILDSSLSNTSVAVRSQMLSVLKIAQACVSVSPEARPKMKNVVRMLLNAR